MSTSNSSDTESNRCKLSSGLLPKLAISAEGEQDEAVPCSGDPREEPEKPVLPPEECTQEEPEVTTPASTISSSTLSGKWWQCPLCPGTMLRRGYKQGLTQPDPQCLSPPRLILWPHILRDKLLRTEVSRLSCSLNAKPYSRGTGLHLDLGGTYTASFRGVLRWQADPAKGAYPWLLMQRHKLYNCI